MLKRIISLTAAAIMLISAAGCGVTANNNGLNAKILAPAEKIDASVVRANTGFGFELLKKIYSSDAGKNIFISPASISIALVMTMNGADNATREAMLKTLGLDGLSLETINFQYQQLKTILENPDPKVQLSIANSIWARKGIEFKNEFMETNKTFFDAMIRELDFNLPKAADEINKWVKDKTKSKIDKMVEPPIDSDTVMFLMNAIYFNGVWENEFDSKLTEDRTFYPADGSSKDVPMMTRKGDYRYFDGEGFQSVYLPYGSGNGRVGMYVFLPDEDNSLDKFTDSIESDEWNKWMDSFSECEGTVVLPKFKHEYETVLNDALKAMGMGIAFDSADADFGKMFSISKEQNIYISNVKHKSYVDVNEKGTEAAAVTSVEMKLTSMPLPGSTFSMVMDRPFMYSIVDELTGTILFIGTVVEP